MSRLRPRSAGLAAAVLCLLLGASPALAASRHLVVFAAASLKNALDAINARFAAKTQDRALISYAASSTLAKQIAAGAPADVFISADEAWMDYLAKRHLIQPASRADLLGNELVLIAPAKSPVKATIGPDFPLKRLLGRGRLAIADPASVPAGIYGKAALEKLGVWPSVKDHLAPAENVRAALLFVARAETPLGIVYATDAASERAVRVIGQFPADTHPPIVYPMALTARSKVPAAPAFARYLQGAAARRIFEKYGFTVLTRRR